MIIQDETGEVLEDQGTDCVDCKHFHPLNEKRTAYYWMCLKQRRLPGYPHLTRQRWHNWDPYNYCRMVNVGICAMFEEKPTDDSAT